MTICYPNNSAKYLPHQNEEWKFSSNGFLLQFSHFDLERGYDFLVIYNSVTENYEEFEEHELTGIHDNKIVRVFSAPFLRLVFTSDGSVQKSGFCADIVGKNTTSVGKSLYICMYSVDF